MVSLSVLKNISFSCIDSFNTGLGVHCFLRAEVEIRVSLHFEAYIVPYTSKTDLLGRVELCWVETWLDFLVFHMGKTINGIVTKLCFVVIKMPCF